MSFNTVDLHRIKIDLISPGKTTVRSAAYWIESLTSPSPSLLTSSCQQNLRVSNQNPAVSFCSVLHLPHWECLQAHLPTLKHKAVEQHSIMIPARYQEEVAGSLLRWMLLSRYSMWQRNHLNIVAHRQHTENRAREHFQLGGHLHQIIQDQEMTVSL